MIQINSKKNNLTRTTATILLTLVIIVLATTMVSSALGSRSVDRFTDRTTQLRSEIAASAPVVVSGDNIYTAWWTNNTENGNEEVMFRASNDAGGTFGDKINLSNTTDADSERVEIAAEGADVIVTWWELNQTSDTPVARLSSDGGATFGPMLRLGTNGTIDSTEEGGEGEAVEVVEEAVGGAEVAE
jgi:hypothetical protein